MLITRQKERPDEGDLTKIELIKWHQRIQEISYIEAGLHMRALNQLMWQVPSLVIVINGGLWYGTTLVSKLAATLIFIMIALFDLLSIVTLYRLRGLLDLKIKQQAEIESQYCPFIIQKLSRQYYPKEFRAQERRSRIKIKKEPSWLSRLFKCCFNKISTHSQGDYTVIGCWSTVLFLCCLISLFGACTPSSFLDKPEKKQSYEIKNVKTNDIITVEKK